MTLLLDYARTNGCAMGSIGPLGQGSLHIGWTTDKPLMERLRAAGATVVTGYGVDPNNPGMPAGRDPKSPETVMGWEISFRQGAEVLEQAA